VLADGTHRRAKAGTVYNFRDLKRIEVDEVYDAMTKVLHEQRISL